MDPKFQTGSRRREVPANVYGEPQKPLILVPPYRLPDQVLRNDCEEEGDRHRSHQFRQKSSLILSQDTTPAPRIGSIPPSPQ